MNREFYAIDPKGSVYLSNDTDIFSKKHNLCHPCIIKYLNREIKSFYGWSFYWKDLVDNKRVSNRVLDIIKNSIVISYL